MFTHDQIGHYWLSLHVSVWVVMHRQVQADFSDLPLEGTTPTCHLTFNLSLSFSSISTFLSVHTSSFSSVFFYPSSCFLHHITGRTLTHTQTQVNGQIPSPHLIRPSANQDFVWQALAMDQLTDGQMNLRIDWWADEWMEWCWVNSQEQSLVIGLLHLTENPIGRNGWLAWMRLGGVLDVLG